jgi:hypothetical protein
MLQIFYPLCGHLRRVLCQKVTAGLPERSVSTLELGDLAAHEIAEQMARRFDEDSVGQRPSGIEVSYLQVQYRGVVSRIRIARVQLIVGSQRHGREAPNLR